jgi:hypothetical protein
VSGYIGRYQWCRAGEVSGFGGSVCHSDMHDLVFDQLISLGPVWLPQPLMIGLVARIKKFVFIGTRTNIHKERNDVRAERACRWHERKIGGPVAREI